MNYKVLKAVQKPCGFNAIFVSKKEQPKGIDFLLKEPKVTAANPCKKAQTNKFELDLGVASKVRSSSADHVRSTEKNILLY